MKFRATILEMASSEIMQHIPVSVYEEIKTKDKHPVFRAYVIGHEGISEGKVVGHGNIVKRWYSSAISKIVDRLQYGLKIFHDHAETNIHKGRQVLGHIVGKTKKIINDNLSAIAIAYIKPEYRNLPLDVASIEADVILNDDKDRGVFDADVEDITGIALGNSAVNRPGFPGATLLSQIQAFANQSQFTPGGGTMTTISEIRDFIKAENLKPSDIYGLGDLTKDPMIEEHIEQAKKGALKGEYEHRKRDEMGFDKTKEKLIEDHNAALKAKDDLISKLQGENIQSKTSGWLETQKEKRKFDDKQMKFINLNLPKFKPEDPEKAEDEFNKFLDDRIDDLGKISKDVFGVEPEEKKSKAPGGESKDKKAGDDFVEDMSLED